MRKIECFCGKEIIFNDEFIPSGHKTEICCLDCGAHFWVKKPIVNEELSESQ